MVRRILSLVLGLGLLAAPAVVLADASIVQLWCHAPDANPNIIEVHFSVINFSLEPGICGLSLRSEPFPPEAHCMPLGVQPTAGWTGSLNNQGGFDWTADAGHCIAPRQMDGEFVVAMPNPDEGFCCYIAQFLDSAGNVLLEQEECFFCAVVPTQTTDWGSFKSLYN